MSNFVEHGDNWFHYLTDFSTKHFMAFIQFFHTFLVWGKFSFEDGNEVNMGIDWEEGARGKEKLKIKTVKDNP